MRNEGVYLDGLVFLPAGAQLVFYSDTTARHSRHQLDFNGFDDKYIYIHMVYAIAWNTRRKPKAEWHGMPEAIRDGQYSPLFIKCTPADSGCESLRCLY